MLAKKFQMQQNPTNYSEWKQTYSTQEACLNELSRRRWKDGFICPKCGHDKSYQLKYRHLRECAGCGRQVSPTAGTVFEHTRLPLPKWFAAIYLMGADQGGISAQRLSKMICVSWPTAYRMLRILRQCMGDRERSFWLEGLVEMDDAFVGGRMPDKRGHGNMGKKPVMFAVEQRENDMGLMAARQVERVNSEQVREFAKRILPRSEIRTDDFKALRVLGESHRHEPKSTSPENVNEWLSKVHTVINKFKNFLASTFHGVSHRYIQEYIDEFVFRFNRRFCEPQLPDQLLQTAVDHVPIRASLNSAYIHDFQNTSTCLQKQSKSNEDEKLINQIEDKRSRGQFYTRGNPFTLQPFLEWSGKIELNSKHILEPFAGSNNIVKALQEINLCKQFSSYDIAPADKEVEQRDTIKSFPQGFEVCVTNPPWLARNSATRRGLPYVNTEFDDLYKHCLELCLKNCDYVAALVPASYLQSGLFRERLSVYILLHDDNIFNDTENPVCLALFNKQSSFQISIYYDDKFLGYLQDLESKIPKPIRNRQVRFNDPEGELGFISFDNIRGPSIRFCEASEVEEYQIKVSSRFITRISGELGNIPVLVKTLNKRIEKFRKETNDIFLTPFKGVRKDGYYRRRMEFALARKLIDAT